MRIKYDYRNRFFVGKYPWINWMHRMLVNWCSVNLNTIDGLKNQELSQQNWAGTSPAENDRNCVFYQHQMSYKNYQELVLSKRPRQPKPGNPAGVTIRSAIFEPTDSQRRTKTVTYCMIYDIRYTIHDIRYTIHDILYTIYDIRYRIYDIWYMIWYDHIL